MIKKSYSSLRGKLKGKLFKQIWNNFLRVLKPVTSIEELAELINPDEYEEIVKNLSPEEVLELMMAMESSGREKWLLDEVSDRIWMDFISSDSAILDHFPSSKLKEILKKNWTNIYNIVRDKTKERQFKILELLDETEWENWIMFMEGEEFWELQDFLNWLCEQETEQEGPETKLFRTMTNISIRPIAKLLENMEAIVAQRILQEINMQKRYELCEQIESEKLYQVIEKTDCFLIQKYPSKTFVKWLYDKLSEVQKLKFISLLRNLLGDEEVVEMIEPKIINGYLRIKEEQQKRKFLKEVIMAGEFEDFCKGLFPEQKREMFEVMIKDNELKAKLKDFLDSKGASRDLVEESVWNLLNK